MLYIAILSRTSTDLSLISTFNQNVDIFYRCQKIIETLHKHGNFFNYRSGTVNSKSFVGKVLLRIKRKFELN